jgi:hypothetical protein
MVIYTMEESEPYAKLMEWARVQKFVINENSHDFGGTEETMFGLNVKEFSRKLYNFLCKWLGHSMESRIDKCQERGLELWRSLSDEYDNQAAQMLSAKMKLYQNPVRTRNMEDLEDKFNTWEQLDRELGAGGSEFAVPDITKAIALALLVPHEIEQQFISAPEGSLKTYQQQIAYVRQRINDDKARTMSAKTLKQANNINGIGMELPKGVEEQGDVDYCDENLINALSHMTKEQIIMYVRGKGKG